MADQQQNTAQPMCAGGCGFFGHPAFDNLCSKCNRDRKQPATATASPSAPAPVLAASAASVSAASAAVASAPSVPSPSSVRSSHPVVDDFDVSMTEIANVAAADNDAGSTTSTPKKRKQRCVSCNAKLGMLGFECRCEQMFCSKHRFPDQHMCSFDYKAHDRDVLAANNPQVAPSKLEAL